VSRTSTRRAVARRFIERATAAWFLRREEVHIVERWVVTSLRYGALMDEFNLNFLVPETSQT
jgi:hypothetical protein